jgi:hypothetical protein
MSQINVPFIGVEVLGTTPVKVYVPYISVEVLGGIYAHHGHYDTEFSSAFSRVRANKGFQANSFKIEILGSYSSSVVVPYMAIEVLGLGSKVEVPVLAIEVLGSFNANLYANSIMLEVLGSPADQILL